MVKALFDTNILIDYLRGAPEARDEFERYGDHAISVISWIEILVGAAPGADAGTRDFLARFEVIALDAAVAEEAAAIRRERRIRLPDAIIWASARRHGRLLVTRNIKDFPPADPGVREPYRL